MCHGVSGRCGAGVGCVGGLLGVLGEWGCCGGCVGRVWGARVGIARSALLSGYIGKSGHLPRLDTYRILAYVAYIT